MGPKENPVPKAAERNILCPFYGGCLDYAVSSSWQCWNCSACQHNKTQQAFPEEDYVISDLVTYYEWPPNVPEAIRNGSVD